MSILAAENCFKKGLAALVDERHSEAIGHFHSAMQIEKQRCVRHPDMRYLSYYGLSVAKVHGSIPSALAACELAAKQNPTHLAVLLNLGRVYVMSGRTSKALECFERGLRVAPGNQAFIKELARVDRRSNPVLPGISRGAILNRWLGVLRARWRRLGGSRLAAGRAAMSS